MIEQTIKIEVENFQEFIENLNYLDKQNIVDWSHLSENISYDIDVKLFIEIYKHKINWKSLSKNREIRWTSSLINKYNNQLDFKILSNNHNISLSQELILKYLEKWDWNNNIISDHKHFDVTLSGLCFNPNFPINVDFIEKIKDYIDWRALGMNKSLHIYNPIHYGGPEYVPIDIESMEENFEVIFKYWDKWHFERTEWINDYALMRGTNKDSIKDNKSINWKYYEELKKNKKT